MKLRLLPRSLATRTALVLVAGLMVVQVVGLGIHALDQRGLQRLAEVRTLSTRMMGVYRAVAHTPAGGRARLLQQTILPPGMSAQLSDRPPVEHTLPLLPPNLHRFVLINLRLFPLPQQLRPRRVLTRFAFDPRRLILGFELANGGWLDVSAVITPPRPWHSPTFLAAFLMMSAAAALLTIWAVRRLTAPVRTLAVAAERLGRDVNAPPLPEEGPLEVATAAAAFNTMAARIRRFVEDRTLLLTAIGHDLRTPITRLRLRAEFMEDEEQRDKMLADLDDLEAMVSATLAFGRQAAAAEPAVLLDLPEMIRTVLDEAGDAKPEMVERLGYQGPTHLTLRARSMGLKRALANLVSNALAYGGAARVTLHPSAGGMVRIEIEDDGPGIPATEMERVFEPFHRVEGSRNRETGGVGLGLPITRDIARAHGGDVTLANRPGGGVRATLTLPA